MNPPSPCPRCGWTNCACRVDDIPAPQVTRYEQRSACCHATVTIEPAGAPLDVQRTHWYRCRTCGGPCDAVWTTMAAGTLSSRG